MALARGSDVFCKEEIIENTFYMTESTIVVYDIAPVLPGHSLVIPRRHVTDITELSDKEMLDMFRSIQRVRPVLFKTYGTSSDSYSLTAQMGKYSGRSVAHLHIHLIPRRRDDKYQGRDYELYTDIERERIKELPKEELMENVGMLRKKLDWRE
jgi:bis(5'-adenosyl)-triphosphatase